MCLRSSLRYEVEARESPTFGEFLIERSATDEIAPSLLSRPRIADEWGMPLNALPGARPRRYRIGL